jgi:hypothetical protein
MLVVADRSDKFPVGTVVKAYSAVGGENRHHEGRPSGTALASATVAANGVLTFTTLAEGLYQLWAEVAGSQANLLVGGYEFPPLGTLRERVAAKRLVAGC